MRAGRTIKAACLSTLAFALSCQLAAGSPLPGDDIAALKQELAHTSKQSAPEQWGKQAHQLCSAFAKHADEATEAEITEGVYLCLDELDQLNKADQSRNQGCQILADNQFNIIALLGRRKSDGPLANKQMQLRASGTAVRCLKAAERPDLWAPAAWLAGTLLSIHQFDGLSLTA